MWGRLGPRVRRESLPFRVAHEDLFPGEPPPSSSQPREQRVWEAPPGSGSGGGGRQEGRRWGQGGRLPTFPLAAEERKAPSSQRLSEAASKSGRARVPYLTAPLAPFLPQRPHPLRGPRPGSCEEAAREEPRGSSASCRCRVPPQPPRRAGS